MKRYIYKPNCKDCLNTNGNYYFTCKTCETDYGAYIKEIKGNTERIIYLHDLIFSVLRFADEKTKNFYKKELLNNLKGNLVRAKN